MPIRYYYNTLIIAPATEKQQYQLYAVIEDTWYWAIEWTTEESAGSQLTDFNTGFLNDIARETLTGLNEIDSRQLKDKFGVFAGYIERGAAEFRNYLSMLSPTPEMKDVVWRISEV